MKPSNEQYEKWKNHLNSIETPADKLAIIRQEAYQTYTKKKKRKKLVTIQLVAVSAIIAIFLISIRMSPVIANTVAKIPGFAPIVELIAEDKGMEDIVNNKYYEELNKRITKKGVTFTLVGAIADEYGMFLPYTIESTKDIEDINFASVKIKQNGKVLEVGSFSYGWVPEKKSKLIEDIFQYQSVSKIDYSNPNFELEITYDSPINETITIPFTLTKPIKETKSYAINKNIKIDGQIIYIRDLKITPLRVGLTLELDPNNSMQILNINKLKLVDEKGEKWGAIQNGIFAMGDFRDDGKKTIFFQSNYFRNPKHLTLTINEVEALPKDDDYIIVDFSKEQILKNPISKDVKIEIINNYSIELQYTKPDNKPHTPILMEAVDQKGTKYYPTQIHTHADVPVVEEYIYNFQNLQNPIKLYINSYSNYLDGSAKIEIPVE